jgi:hypothetical protein
MWLGKNSMSVGFGSSMAGNVEPSPVKSASKKVAAKSVILQGGTEPLSSAPVWAEPSQLLIGMWPPDSGCGFHRGLRPRPPSARKYHSIPRLDNGVHRPHQEPSHRDYYCSSGRNPSTLHSQVDPKDHRSQQIATNHCIKVITEIVA